MNWTIQWACPSGIGPAAAPGERGAAGLGVLLLLPEPWQSERGFPRIVSVGQVKGEGARV